MRQIRYATTIPQIYNTAIIIGACRVITRNDEESEDSGFDMDQCCWNDARMDMKRVAQLGHRQTWPSAKRATGGISLSVSSRLSSQPCSSFGGPLPRGSAAVVSVTSCTFALLPGYTDQWIFRLDLYNGFAVGERKPWKLAFFFITTLSLL